MRPGQCAHPDPDQVVQAIGREIYEGCPELEISDDSRYLFDLFLLSHSETPQGFQRHITFQEILALPARIAQAFGAIEAEVNMTRQELSGGSV